MGGRPADGGDRQDNDMAQFCAGQARAKGLADGGVDRAFVPVADREGEFDKAASLLIERSRTFVARFSEGGKGLPDLWVVLLKRLYLLRSRLAIAHTI